MSRKRKVMLTVAIVFGSVILVVAAIGGIYAWRFTRASRGIVIEDVDVSRVPNGEYRGAFKVFHVSAEVLVTVEDGRITGVKLVKGDGNRKHVEAAMAEVVDRQSLRVDTVGGATVSQKAALKAIENALGESGP